MSELKGKIDHPAFAGELSEVPLFAVLRQIQRARLTGRLQLSRAEQWRWLFFESGELRAARSSVEEHRLGATLLSWGYLTRRDLDRALQAQRSGGMRLDELLVEMGLVSRTVLDAESRRLMEHIVSSALSWSAGNFRFEANAGGGHEDIAFSLSLTEIIIEGIRRIPESQEFLGPLGDLSRAPRVGVHALAEAQSLRLPADASFLLSRVDGKTSAQDLLRLIPGSRRAAAKILYTLIYCGFIEFPESPVTRNAAGGEVEASAPERTSRHRELVHSTYRRTDWLSHYDLLGLTLDATPKQIDEAYSQLRGLFDPVLSERPDLSDCRRELIVLSRRLRVAYEVLSRPSSRARYDTEIRRAEALLPPGSGEEGAVRPEATERSAKVRRWTASKNYKRAQELIEKNDFFPAIEMLEEAIRFVPDNGRYRLLLGRAQMKNRWWAEEGMANLEEAARLEPRSAEIQSALAEAYLERGAPEKALPYARQALNVANPANKGRYRDLELRAEQAAQPGAAEQTSGRSRRGIA